MVHASLWAQSSLLAMVAILSIASFHLHQIDQMASTVVWVMDEANSRR